MRLISKIKTLTILVAVPLSVFAQQKRSTAILPLDPAVRTGKLANGFTYYIRHNEEPKNRVLLYLVNKAGSILEDEDQRGLAHFMEHMNFNGTKHFPKNELVDYLQKSGIRFGADLNAYTSFDETVYQLPIPSNKPALLAGGIQIMRDWAQEATLDPREIDNERGVVLEEKRLGKGAYERMSRQFMPVLMNNSRYAERDPIGIDTVLDNFKRPAIARFYHDWYRPDLQALIVVGDINTDSLEKVVRKQFSNLKNPVHEKFRPKFSIPLDGKNHFVAVTDKEMTYTFAEVIIKHPLRPLHSESDYRSDLIRNLFNQMLGERYVELMHYGEQPFIQLSAGIYPLMGGLSRYKLSVVAQPGKLDQSFKSAWRATERVRRFGFTISELTRAKTASLNKMETAFLEKDKTNSENYVNDYKEYFLRGTAAPGIIKEAELTHDYLPAITLAEVNALAKAYITTSNRDIIIQAPDKDKAALPSEIAVNRWLSEISREQMSPYTDKVSDQRLLAAKPIPGKVVMVQKNPALNTTTLILSNGLKVILKPTNFKADQIAFTAFAQGGTSVYDDANYQSAANSVGIVTEAGAGNYDADKLSKYLEGKTLYVQPYISEHFQGIDGSTVKKELETALQLTYAYFTKPRIDSTVFNNMIRSSKALLANRAADPNKVFMDTVSAIMNNYNIRKTGPSAEKLQEISLDKAYSIYKDRFEDASAFTFVFVGSIDTSTMLPLIARYLGSLPATHKNSPWVDLHIHEPGGHLEKKVYKGADSKATVILDFSGKFDYSPENELQTDALKECLEIRLLERLREQESGVYSPSVQINCTKLGEPHYSVMVQFGCAPQNVDKLISSTLDEVHKLETEGPSQENVDKWRAEDKNTMETKLQTNGFWVQYLQDQTQTNANWNEVLQRPGTRDRVTPASLKKMAVTYLNGNNFIQIVLLPESMASSN